MITGGACRFNFDTTSDAGDGNGDQGWLETWAYRKPITIAASAVEQQLAGFPVPIVLDGDPDVIAHAHATGRDLRFTLDDGVTPVPFEIEQFDQTAGRIAAWITPATLSPASSTVVYVYYGNPTSDAGSNASLVYANDFRGVWHFGDVPAVGSSLSDVSPGNHDGTFSAGMSATNSVAGVVGRALDFDGIDDYVTIPDALALRFMDQPFTIEAWVFMRDANGFKILSKGQNRPPVEYYFRTGNETDDRLLMRVYDQGGDAIGRAYFGGLIAYENQWIHVATTYDGSGVNGGLALYLNGARVDTDDADLNIYNGMYAGTSDIEIGHYAEGMVPPAGHWANGIMDDIRVSAVARSPAWIRAANDVVQARASVFMVGPQETR